MLMRSQMSFPNCLRTDRQIPIDVTEKPVFSCMFRSCGIFMLCVSWISGAEVSCPFVPVGRAWQSLQLTKSSWAVRNSEWPTAGLPVR